MEGKGSEAWQREFLLRFRDKGDSAAKAELLSELQTMLERRVASAFGTGDPDVGSRILAAASPLLDPLVSHIPLDGIRAAGGVDLVAETLDPDELEDELGADDIAERALTALRETSGDGLDDTVTAETAEERSQMIEQFSALLLPLIREHHIKGRFAVDHGQADLDRVQEMTGKAMSRIATVVREVPDRIVRDDPDEIEERLLGDRPLLALIEFDPRAGYLARKADAAVVAEKAAAAKQAAQQAAARAMRARPGRTVRRRTTTPARRAAAAPPPRIEPKPYVPTLLDLLPAEEEERLMAIMRQGNEAWGRGDAFSDSARRDELWDPVTEQLDALDGLALRRMLALIRAGRIHVIRGFVSEIERIQKTKS